MYLWSILSNTLTCHAPDEIWVQNIPKLFSTKLRLIRFADKHPDQLFFLQKKNTPLRLIDCWHYWKLTIFVPFTCDPSSSSGDQCPIELGKEFLSPSALHHRIVRSSRTESSRSNRLVGSSYKLYFFFGTTWFPASISDRTPGPVVGTWE